MNAVGLYQSEAAPQVRIGTPLTMMAERNDGVLQDATEVFFFEETLVLVPNESPMHGHRSVFVHPALRTQQFPLQAIATRDFPQAVLDTTSAAGEEGEGVIPGQKTVQEYVLLSLELAHVVLQANNQLF
jgi:hypothetical protein